MSERPEVDLNTPPVRRAAMPEVRIYPITEDELDRLEKGGHADSLFQYAAPTLAFGLSMLVTLGCSEPRWKLIETPGWGLAWGSSLCGAVLMAVWWKSRKDNPTLAQRIRDRLRSKTSPLLEAPSFYCDVCGQLAGRQTPEGAECTSCGWTEVF